MPGILIRYSPFANLSKYPDLLKKIRAQQAEEAAQKAMAETQSTISAQPPSIPAH